jgi:4-hydroxy-tetrahydrodipicolinate reductase
VSAARIVLWGASGRMGRALQQVIDDDVQTLLAGAVAHEVVSTLVGPRHRVLETSLGLGHAARFDAVIDFTRPEVFSVALAAARDAKAAFVSGTTGLGAEHFAALDDAARVIPVLWEPNMSIGVLVLTRLVEQAVKAMGEGFDVEIVEAHHRRKVDAPSGTALRLGEAALRARPALVPVHGREGKPGERGSNELGYHAVRGGDVVGDHQVHLLGLGERLELTHRATDRTVFARGAVRAAKELVGRAPGRYRLADLV